MLRAALPVLVDASIPAIIYLTFTTVHAGFPSAATDYTTKATNLNAALIKNPQATYLMRIAGSSMRDAGIDDCDVFQVDRAIRSRHGSIIIVAVDRDFTCKRLYRRGTVLKLQAANPTYPDFVPSEGQTMELWGVVTKVIKSFVR